MPQPSCEIVPRLFDSGTDAVNLNQLNNGLAALAQQFNSRIDTVRQEAAGHAAAAMAMADDRAAQPSRRIDSKA